MTFTDDDLKRLKELSQKVDLEDEVAENAAVWALESLSALLARLEAAEQVVEAHCRLEQEKISYDNFVLLLNKWRKAAGK